METVTVEEIIGAIVLVWAMGKLFLALFDDIY